MCESPFYARKAILGSYQTFDLERVQNADVEPRIRPTLASHQRAQVIDLRLGQFHFAFSDCRRNHVARDIPSTSHGFVASNVFALSFASGRPGLRLVPRGLDATPVCRSALVTGCPLGTDRPVAAGFRG